MRIELNIDKERHSITFRDVIEHLHKNHKNLKILGFYETCYVVEFDEKKYIIRGITLQETKTNKITVPKSKEKYFNSNVEFLKSLK